MTEISQPGIGWKPRHSDSVLMGRWKLDNFRCPFRTTLLC